MCVCVCVCVCVCHVCVFMFVCFHIMHYVSCFGRTVFYMCIEYCIQVNMSDVSIQGVEERMIDAHYCCY